MTDNDNQEQRFYESLGTGTDRDTADDTPSTGPQPHVNPPAAPDGGFTGPAANGRHWGARPPGPSPQPPQATPEQGGAEPAPPLDQQRYGGYRQPPDRTVFAGPPAPSEHSRADAMTPPRGPSGESTGPLDPVSGHGTAQPGTGDHPTVVDPTAQLPSGQATPAQRRPRPIDDEHTTVVSRDELNAAGIGPAAPAGPSVDDQPPATQEPRWSQHPQQPSYAEAFMREQIRATELVEPRKIPSSRGWRKWLYRGSFKTINVGESPDERWLRDLNTTVAAPLRGTYSIVVLGGKGGVGKTTAAAAVGSTFAALRTDKTVAIDANPDRASNLADRIDPKANNSYREVLRDKRLGRYSDMRSHVGENKAGLDVLAGARGGGLSARMFADTHQQLQRFYSILISDSGTDVYHPVVPALVGTANSAIMVASALPDGAQGAADLMDWLAETGQHRLLKRTVVLINEIRNDRGRAHRRLVETLEEKFARRVGPGQVFVIPYDPHIASAGPIDITQMRPQTRRRFLEVTSVLASGFAATEDRR